MLGHEMLLRALTASPFSPQTPRTLAAAHLCIM